MKPVSQRKSAIALIAIQEAASEPVYRRGVQYYRRKKVLKYEESGTGDYIEALVIGSEPQPYKVTVNIVSSNEFKAECSCPYFEELCKHSIAVLLTHIARVAPGTRFDLVESDSGNLSGQERASKAKDLLDDPRALLSKALISQTTGAVQTASDTVSKSEDIVVLLATAHPEVTLGMLILEKPLALIIGIIPDAPQGKVNILKVPSETINAFASGSRMYRLIKYLSALPQTTKGTAGGHRIPRGEEGIVVGHLSVCCQLVNTINNEKLCFSQETIKPQAILSETENGELLLKLAALKEDDTALDHAIYFMGPASWVLSGNTFYPIDLSPIHRLFPYFDAFGQMTIKLDIVPKFLSVDLPVLMKRMSVRLDDSSAPIPVAITEPPQVVIKLTEKQRLNKETGQSNPEEAQLEVSLGFRYGNLVLPSRDETSAVESETYTRTISENGQSVWVKRAWAQESEVRRFLNNLQPDRVLVDRFLFVSEPALDAVYYLSSPQCAEWEITGFDSLGIYRVSKEGLNLEAKLSLTEDSYKFDLELLCSSDDQSVAFASVVESLFRNRNYVKLANGKHVHLEATTLLGLLKLIGQSQEKARPLYQALMVLHALEAHAVKISPDAGFSKFVEKIYNFGSLPALSINKDFTGSLREYQQEGCNWLAFLREYGLAGILADDMGLGKTIQTLALLLTHHKNKSKSGKRAPSLVVAPTSVVYNWLSEAQKFTPSISTALFLGRDRHEILSRLSPDNPRCPDVVFTTYGIIRRDYETLKKYQFEYLVLDEAQNIKNPDSVGAVGCKSIRAFHRVALSGTPVENRLKELWSLFDFLMPEFLGPYKDFNDTYEKPIEAGMPGAGQKLRKIVSPFILRRLKSQVEKELPDRTDIVNLCELEDDQRALYLDVLDECRQKVFSDIASQGLARSQISVLTALLRLRQVCCDPRLVKNPPQSSVKTEKVAGVTSKSKNGDNGNGNSKTNVPPLGSAKLTALMAMIGEVVEEGHKILVFSQFVEMLAIIEKELKSTGYTYEYIDGQVPAKERLDRVNRFNADPSIPIFLISLKAGGTGLNLTGADYVIHYDPWWNPAVENQATDRAHRIGQTRHVFNYKLITRGTVEEKIIALQKKKKELAELVLGAGDESIAKELTKEDLEFLFSF
jgi:SNF2 family DNA or RNA helicase